MNIIKKRKGAYAIAAALVVLFAIVVLLTLSPAMKQTAIDLLTAIKGTAA